MQNIKNDPVFSSILHFAKNIDKHIEKDIVLIKTLVVNITKNVLIMLNNLQQTQLKLLQKE